MGNLILRSKGLCILLALSLVAISSGQAWAGVGTFGGGFYGKVKVGNKYKWVLLDELEGGTILDPNTIASGFLMQLDSALPELSNRFRSLISAKTWHIVPFELTCETPQSAVNVEIVAAACQDKRDVWIDKSKFKGAEQKKLIVHELVQALRLELNQERDEARQISTSAVRAVTRALIQSPFPTGNILQTTVEDYGFGHYTTFEEYREIEADYQRRFQTIAPEYEHYKARFNEAVEAAKVCLGDPTSVSYDDIAHAMNINDDAKDLNVKVQIAANHVDLANIGGELRNDFWSLGNLWQTCFDFAKRKSGS